MVVYPNEGHSIADSKHIYDLQQRSLDWFAKYLGAGG